MGGGVSYHTHFLTLPWGVSNHTPAWPSGAHPCPSRLSLLQSHTPNAQLKAKEGVGSEPAQ